MKDLTKYIDKPVLTELERKDMQELYNEINDKSTVSYKDKKLLFMSVYNFNSIEERNYFINLYLDINNLKVA